MAEGLAQALAQSVLPGVAEGRVAQVMAHGNGLRQVLVEPQRPGDGSGDAADLQGVGHPGAVVVALGLQKHLRLVHQAAGRPCSGRCGPCPAGSRYALSSARLLLTAGVRVAPVGQGRQGEQSLVLLLFQFFTHVMVNSLIPLCMASAFFCLLLM